MWYLRHNFPQFKKASPFCDTSINQVPHYLRFYDQAEIRKENVGNEERVPVTLELIPDKINSLLD